MMIREKVLNELARSPRRARELAPHIGLTRMECIEVLHVMEDEGLVTRRAYRDIGNMEFYDLWEVKKNEGK